MQKNFLLYLIIIVLYASGCTPKVGVLRSPDYKGEVGTRPSDSDDDTDEDDGEVATDPLDADEVTGSNVALLLPFQLHQISTTSVVENDIKRSALALDFYQGFQMGLEESTKTSNILLDVIDSRDDNFYSGTLAKSVELENASIVVGPVYPKEIQAFGENFANKNVLQVNPLAASMPSEFNLPNLVSLTPPIVAHANAIAAEVARRYVGGDVIVVFNTADNDGRQFLSGMVEKVRQARSGVRVVSVSSVRQLNENLSTTGATHVVAGTTDKMQIRSLINNLSAKSAEGFTFELYGHPLWDRYDWSIYPNFTDFSPRITTESAMKPWTAPVRDFKQDYFERYGVQPSDHSYKGYDCARYFTMLLNKYDKDSVKDHLTEEPFQGLYSNYKFIHNDAWGYSNSAVSIRVYGGDGFQLQ